MKKLDGLDIATIIMTAFIVLLISYFTAVDLQRFVAQGELLSVLELDNWSVLASGGVHVLSYPTACMLSNVPTGAGNLSKAVLIACQPNTYVAIVTNGDYYVSCNATEEYEGWRTVDKYHGYVHVFHIYNETKALSCIEVNASYLQDYLLGGCGGWRGGHIPPMYWGAYGKIIIDSWSRGFRGGFVEEAGER